MLDGLKESHRSFYARLSILCIMLFAIFLASILFVGRAANVYVVFILSSLAVLISTLIFALSVRRLFLPETASVNDSQDIQAALIDELTAKIAESDRLATLGQLTAGVAHELNNPLGGILVYSHLLKEDTEEKDPRLANIDKIIRESNRCKRIVKSLLDYSCQSTPVMSKTDVTDLIRNALGNISSEQVFENVSITENMGQDIPEITADESQIQEVFENIIRNAAEIMINGGDLKISCALLTDDSSGDTVEISFTDSGPGISSEQMKHIFDPFYTTKIKAHGTGLGLAVSHGIIERHKGSIKVRNHPEGGAEFTVSLSVDGGRS